MTFITNIKDAFVAETDEQDRGSLVETVLLIAGFAVVAILVVTWIGNAIAGQAADVSNCISNSNAYGTSAGAETECAKSTQSDKVETKQAAANTKRFG